MELINELGTQLIKSFAEGLIALSGAGLLYLIAIARKKILAETEKIKNEDQRNLVKATIEKVDNLAKITVQNAEQVMVKEAKSTTEDGKLTKEDANKVKNAVKNGICYVQFTSVTTRTSSNGQYIIPKGTLPAIDNSLSNGRYPVVGGGSKSGMVAVDGNTGGIKYYGGAINIFTTISYPVAEQ